MKRILEFIYFKYLSYRLNTRQKRIICIIVRQHNKHHSYESLIQDLKISDNDNTTFRNEIDQLKRWGLINIEGPK
jgi:hypothetical protein